MAEKNRTPAPEPAHPPHGQSGSIALQLAQEEQDLHGRAIFDGTYCQYADAVKPGDLIAANFDVRDVHTGGGLFLIEERASGRVTWRGCRRMIRVPQGVSVDQDGHGDWVTLPSLEECRWRVVGVVETVYRPTGAA